MMPRQRRSLRVKSKFTETGKDLPALWVAKNGNQEINDPVLPIGFYAMVTNVT